MPRCDTIINGVGEFVGKTLDHFEVCGIEVGSLDMVDDDLVMVFTDGSKLALGMENYGRTIYISQVEVES